MHPDVCKFGLDSEGMFTMIAVTPFAEHAPSLLPRNSTQNEPSCPSAAVCINLSPHKHLSIHNTAADRNPTSDLPLQECTSRPTTSRALHKSNPRSYNVISTVLTHRSEVLTSHLGDTVVQPRVFFSRATLSGQSRGDPSCPQHRSGLAHCR